MIRVMKILAKILSLLVISGMILHGVVPHHHHDSAGEVNTCCETHHHEGDSNQSEHDPCTILSSIHFENHKPQVTVLTQNLNHNHFNDLIAICPLNHFSEQNPIFIESPIPLFLVGFTEIESNISISRRGPPLV